MTLYHKKESIHYGTVPKKESIRYGAVSQEGEYPL